MQVHPIFLDFVQSYQQPAYRYWLRFQSTLPARGATAPCPALNPAAYFNPRSPRGERRYPHRLHSWLLGFQSTLPARGATALDTYEVADVKISIHAPREGSDICISRSSGAYRHFNPRSPRGERLEVGKNLLTGLGISIHAPREGSDTYEVVTG